MVESEAIANYEKYKNVDPFPDILPSLLNINDVFKYINKVGLIFPFSRENFTFKGASFAVKMLGQFVYWEKKNGNPIITDIKNGDVLKIKPNSISFITLEPMFRVPSYLALRFNLCISHVYKGLLLGTGPMVDPGYENHLSIPLHNITSNTYYLYGGQDLIWMEITKLSPSHFWNSSEESQSTDELTGFNELASNKKNFDIMNFITRALHDQKNGNTQEIFVLNSTPIEIDSIKNIIDNSNNNINNIKNQNETIINELKNTIETKQSTFENKIDVKTNEFNDKIKNIQTLNNWSLFSVLITLLLAIVFTVLPLIQIYKQTLDLVKGSIQDAKENVIKINDLESRLKIIDDKINSNNNKQNITIPKLEDNIK